MLLIDDFAKLELQVLLLSSVTQSSGNEEASGVSVSGLEVEDLMGITALVNITENSIEDVLEEAANYTINISDEINKKFTNGNKKYRLMKVVRAKPFGREKKSESVETNVLRNIKLEVDGKGNKKVPNLFKIRRKARYPNYVRKHRQIYRGDFPDYPGKKLDHQPGLKNKIVAVSENSASESKIAPTFAHIGPVAPLQGGHHGVTPVPASGPSSFAPTKAPLPPSPTRAPPRYPRSTAGRSYHYTTRSSFVSVQFGRAPVQTVTAPSSPVYPVSGHSSTLPPLLPSYVSPSPTPSKAPLVLSSPAPSLSPLVLSPLPPSKAPSVLSSPAPSLSPLVLSPLPPSKAPSVVSSPAPSVAPLILSSPFPVASSTPHISSLPPTFGPHLSASAAAPKIYKSSISLKKTTTSSTTTTSIPKTTTSTFTTTTGKVTSSTPSSVLPPQTVSLGLPLVPEPVQPVRVQLQPSVVHLPGPPVPRPHLPVSPGPSPLPAAPGHIAVGSRAHIDNLFRDYERTGTILSLYDEDRNIKLLGPIAVRATGPSTFQVIDTNRFERHQPLVVIPNNIQTHPATTKKTTKRPSLHFEPIKEKTRKEKVLPAKINLSSKNLGAGWNVLDEPLGDQYRSRRWPSKPTPRSNVNRRHRSLKVRFEDLSNGSSEVAPKKHFRFPS